MAVTRELLKQVYVKEGLQPPSIAAIREAYASIWSQVSNPGFVGGLIRSGDIGRVGIYGLQAYGVFKVRMM
jgi:F-type H+-transporting ATPase subunit g